VTWAKKAQNGILFVSEALATFFQEEKKFNTTWEGDSAGMVRLLALLDHLDLEQVRRTGDLARRGLDALARQYREIVKNVRGAGVMLAFDVVRADLREALLDRAFRRGLLLLPAGERAVRFYPRYDTSASAIDDALSILRAALQDFDGGSAASGPAGLARQGAESATAAAPKIRVGSLDIPLETIETLTLTSAEFEATKQQILAVEQDRYGNAPYPSDVLRLDGRPLVQFPLATLEATMANPRAIGVALRDRVSGRIVGYAWGAPSKITMKRASAPIRTTATTTPSSCRRWRRSRP
jgi:4-aminobutyrate aminotransferase and related aminotransferases